MTNTERVASKPQPSKKSIAALERRFTDLHVWLYRTSGGRLGGKMGKAPILLLTTTGRKSGKLRTTPLLYLQDGDNLVLVASHGGAPQHPTWWLNLRDNPRAEVEIGRTKQVVIASEVDSEERSRLWPLLVAMYPGYADYQRRTTRTIPVISLHRVDDSDAN